MIVPCGVCLECKKKYQNSWIVRLGEQLKSSKFKAVFFTLTYADEAIPKNIYWKDSIYKTLPDYRYDDKRYFVCEDTGEFIDSDTDVEIVDFNKKGRDIKDFYKDIKDNGLGDRAVMFNSVRKKDVQEWNNRCRKAYRKATGNTTKYFITSEYGPRTLRPHYHGIMFGIDAVDFKRYFKKDWVKHFGREGYEDKCVIVEDVDPRLGGLAYVAKYCSKGVFEHPFCSKNFFYSYKEAGQKKFSEFHSKHYERCIEYFGVDEPLVDPADRLISIHIGADFLKDDRLMRYYEVGIDDVIDYDLKRISNESAHWLGLDSCEVEEDGTIYKRVNIQSAESEPGYELDDLISYEGKRNFTYDKSPVRQFMKIGDKYYSKVYRFIEDHCYQDVDIQCVDGTMYTKSLGDYLLNLNKKILYSKNVKDKTGKDNIIQYAMPKYYREKMFGDEVRHLFACTVSQELDRLYQEQYDQLRASNPDWEDVEISIFIERQAQEESERRRGQVIDKYKEFLNKSRL